MANGDDEQSGPVASLYYPLFDGEGSCVNDGNQPTYYAPSDMFDNKGVSAVQCTVLWHHHV